MNAHKIRELGKNFGCSMILVGILLILGIVGKSEIYPIKYQVEISNGEFIRISILGLLFLITGTFIVIDK